MVVNFTLIICLGVSLNFMLIYFRFIFLIVVFKKIFNKLFCMISQLSILVFYRIFKNICRQYHQMHPVFRAITYRVLILYLPLSNLVGIYSITTFSNMIFEIRHNFKSKLKPEMENLITLL